MEHNRRDFIFRKFLKKSLILSLHIPLLCAAMLMIDHMDDFVFFFAICLLDTWSMHVISVVTNVFLSHVCTHTHTLSQYILCFILYFFYPISCTFYSTIFILCKPVHYGLNSFYSPSFTSFWLHFMTHLIFQQVALI